MGLPRRHLLLTTGRAPACGPAASSGGPVAGDAGRGDRRAPEAGPAGAIQGRPA
jgi:hypothetical protein